MHLQQPKLRILLHSRSSVVGFLFFFFFFTPCTSQLHALVVASPSFWTGLMDQLRGTKMTQYHGSTGLHSVGRYFSSLLGLCQQHEVSFIHLRGFGARLGGQLLLPSHSLHILSLYACSALWSGWASRGATCGPCVKHSFMHPPCGNWLFISRDFGRRSILQVLVLRLVEAASLKL